jgi:hypothetical protein
MVSLEAMLREALETAQNERELQPFLKQYPLIIRNALNAWAWNYVAVLPEFCLGSNYRADFLILSADSGAWYSVLVELKSHCARPFTQAGVPSKDLNLAMRQIDDWKRWIERHQQYFRESLSRYLACEGDVPAMCSRADIHTRAKTEILDPRIVIRRRFRIVIGRREHFSPEDQERRGSHYDRGQDIVSYDRLLDAARRLDEAERII